MAIHPSAAGAAQLTSPGEQEAARRHYALPHLTFGRIAVVAAAALLLWTLSDIVLLVFFAALLAAALRGAANWIAAHTPLPVGVALTLVVLVVMLALGMLAYWTGPALFGQSQDLIHRLIGQFWDLRQRLEGTPLAPGGVGLQTLAEHAAAPATTVLTISLRTVADLVVLFVTTIYFAAAPDVYVDGVLRLVPIPHRARVREVMGEIAHTLRMWLLGQLVDMLAVGLLAAIGLWLVGVPAPFALGALSGVFTFVPYLGTVVSGAVAVLIAFSVSLKTALWALAVFTLCHIVEGYVISPLIQRRMVELPPALTVLAMTVLGALFGLLGVMLGTPIAAAGLVSVRMLYVTDVLGDPEPERRGNR